MSLEARSCVPLHETQIECAAMVLANAFHADPLYRYLLSDDRERARCLSPFFARFLAVAQKVAGVWCIGAPITGVAVCVTPQRQMECQQLMEAARIRELPLVLGKDIAAQFMKFLVWLDELHGVQMRGPHLYLMLLGVDPRWQRQGIGTSLVRHLLHQADAEELYCYVETQQPANVPFYRKLGFDVAVEQATEPTTGLSAWLLKRSPRSP